MIREPYTKEIVRAVVERRGSDVVPLAFHKWWGQGTWDKHGEKLSELGADIPDDIRVATYTVPGAWESPTADPHYRWAYSGSPSPEGTSLDARIQLPDWRDLDAYLAEFPDISRQQGAFDAARAVVQRHPHQYVLGHWWYCFYERLWAIRGMQNVLLDFIEHPAELKRLSRAILDHHVKVIRVFAAAGVDGIFTSDDLGSQRALMMSPAVFRRTLKPLYAELFAECHSLGLHFWLHACGNIQAILGDLIEVGLDVIHPIQAHTMDYQEVVERFGGKITFSWWGWMCSICSRRARMRRCAPACGTSRASFAGPKAVSCWPRATASCRRRRWGISGRSWRSQAGCEGASIAVCLFHSGKFYLD